MLDRIRSSFSAKLTLGILVLAVPIFLASLGIMFYQSRQMILYEAEGRANSVLKCTMQHIIRNTQAIETATNSNMWLIENMFQPDSLLSISRHIVERNPHIDGCSISTEPDVFPEKGDQYSVYTIRRADSIVSVVETPYNYRSKIWYSLPYKNRKPIWIAYYDEGDTLEVTLDGMVATYARPIYSADKTILGIVSTDMSLLRLSKLISEERPYPNSYFMMVDQEGRFFIHPDSTKLFRETIFSGAQPREQADVIALGHEMTRGKEGHMNVVIDGEPCLVSYQPVPHTTWSLALVSPDRDILRSYHRFANVVVVLLILGLLGILLLCYRTVSHTIRPLNKLLEDAQRIAAGDRQVQIDFTDREDAIGGLQNSFATMIESIRFHIQSIRATSEQARQRNEELAVATRLAEEADSKKSAFIQNIYHQIRTPLNIIMGFAQVLRNSISEGEEIPEEEKNNISCMMCRNASILNRMLLMLYDSSDTALAHEIANNKNDKVSCNEIARESINHTNRYYNDASIRLESEVPDDFRIQTNGLYLMLSLRELIFNAAKYSDRQHIVVRIKRHDDKVQFIVEDTGKPISEEDQEWLFKFFAKADDLSEGLGLGLPLSQRHIQNLGGDLWLDKDYQKGCRFIIEMPL